MIKVFFFFFFLFGLLGFEESFGCWVCREGVHIIDWLGMEVFGLFDLTCFVLWNVCCRFSGYYS